MYTIRQYNKRRNNYMFYTIDREAGNKIEAFDTLEEAKKTIIAYEKEDKHNGIYEANFYSVVDDDCCIVD